MLAMTANTEIITGTPIKKAIASSGVVNPFFPPEMFAAVSLSVPLSVALSVALSVSVGLSVLSEFLSVVTLPEVCELVPGFGRGA